MPKQLTFDDLPDRVPPWRLTGLSSQRSKGGSRLWIVTCEGCEKTRLVSATKWKNGGIGSCICGAGTGKAPIRLTYQGVTMSLPEWAERLNTPRSVLYQRLKEQGNRPVSWVLYGSREPAPPPEVVGMSLLDQVSEALQEEFARLIPDLVRDLLDNPKTRSRLDALLNPFLGIARPGMGPEAGDMVFKDATYAEVLARCRKDERVATLVWAQRAIYRDLPLDASILEQAQIEARQLAQVETSIARRLSKEVPDAVLRPPKDPKSTEPSPFDKVFQDQTYSTLLELVGEDVARILWRDRYETQAIPLRDRMDAVNELVLSRAREPEPKPEPKPEPEPESEPTQPGVTVTPAQPVTVTPAQAIAQAHQEDSIPLFLRPGVFNPDHPVSKAQAEREAAAKAAMAAKTAARNAPHRDIPDPPNIAKQRERQAQQPRLRASSWSQEEREEHLKGHRLLPPPLPKLAHASLRDAPWLLEAADELAETYDRFWNTYAVDGSGELGNVWLVDLDPDVPRLPGSLNPTLEAVNNIPPQDLLRWDTDGPLLKGVTRPGPETFEGQPRWLPFIPYGIDLEAPQVDPGPFEQTYWVRRYYCRVPRTPMDSTHWLPSTSWDLACIWWRAWAAIRTHREKHPKDAPLLSREYGQLYRWVLEIPFECAEALNEFVVCQWLHDWLHGRLPNSDGHFIPAVNTNAQANEVLPLFERWLADLNEPRFNWQTQVYLDGEETDPEAEYHHRFRELLEGILRGHSSTNTATLQVQLYHLWRKAGQEPLSLAFHDISPDPRDTTIQGVDMAVARPLLEELVELDLAWAAEHPGAEGAWLTFARQPLP
jgi:hypothetical protein